MDSSGSGKGPVTGCYEHSSELSGSINGRMLFIFAKRVSAYQEELCSMQLFSIYDLVCCKEGNLYKAVIVTLIQCKRVVMKVYLM
jgi:hypothetical protein